MRLRQAAPVSHVHLGTRRERVVSTPIAFSGYWPTYDSIMMTPSGNLGTQPSERSSALQEDMQEEGMTDVAVCRGFHRAVRGLRDGGIKKDGEARDAKLVSFGSQTRVSHSKSICYSSGLEILISQPSSPRRCCPRLCRLCHRLRLWSRFLCRWRSKMGLERAMVPSTLFLARIGIACPLVPPSSGCLAEPLFPRDLFPSSSVVAGVSRRRLESCTGSPQSIARACINQKLLYSLSPISGSDAQCPVGFFGKGQQLYAREDESAHWSWTSWVPGSSRT